MYIIVGTCCTLLIKCIYFAFLSVKTFLVLRSTCSYHTLWDVREFGQLLSTGLVLCQMRQM